jgi:uncharacterized protein (TIGR00730 family)
MFRILSEFTEGFEFIADLKKAVAVFGSARALPNDPWYREAEALGKMMAKEKLPIVTGGGPGIMEAANKGAVQAGGESIGINIDLPEGQLMNEYVKKSVGFHYFFVRKVMLSFACGGYVFFPGGYGTLDELFEMITLLQTKKLSHPVKIVLVGEKYWTPLLSWFKKNLVEEYRTLRKSELELFVVAKDAKEASSIIRAHYKKNGHSVK